LATLESTPESVKDWRTSDGCSALLFDLLAVWAPEETTRKRILVDNPENLYGFAKSV
jgi:hypothetical protein